MNRHTANRATSSRAASQIATEYNGLARRDSTALNLSATSTALAIEVGRAVEQAGAIEVIERKVVRDWRQTEEQTRFL